MIFYLTSLTELHRSGSEKDFHKPKTIFDQINVFLISSAMITNWESKKTNITLVFSFEIVPTQADNQYKQISKPLLIIA